MSMEPILELDGVGKTFTLHLRGGARLIAVVYDHELVDELPAEPTDVPVHAALTPSGLIELSRNCS